MGKFLNKKAIKSGFWGDLCRNIAKIFEKSWFLEKKVFLHTDENSKVFLHRCPHPPPQKYLWSVPYFPYTISLVMDSTVWYTVISKIEITHRKHKDLQISNANEWFKDMVQRCCRGAFSDFSLKVVLMMDKNALRWFW